MSKFLLIYIITSKAYEERLKNSPISLTKNLQKPLYIVHGTEDLRVPVTQARQLKKTLKKDKKAFKYKEYSNLGHWFTDEKKLGEFMQETVSFFDQNLKKSN